MTKFMTKFNFSLRNPEENLNYGRVILYDGDFCMRLERTTKVIRKKAIAPSHGGFERKNKFCDSPKAAAPSQGG